MPTGQVQNHWVMARTLIVSRDIRDLITECVAGPPQSSLGNTQTRLRVIIGNGAPSAPISMSSTLSAGRVGIAFAGSYPMRELRLGQDDKDSR